MAKFLESFYSALGTTAVIIIGYLIIVATKYFFIWWFPISKIESKIKPTRQGEKLKFEKTVLNLLHWKFLRWYRMLYDDIDWTAVAQELTEHEKILDGVSHPITSQNAQEFIVIRKEHLESMQGREKIKRLELLIELGEVNEAKVYRYVRGHNTGLIFIPVEEIEKRENKYAVIMNKTDKKYLGDFIVYELTMKGLGDKYPNGKIVQLQQKHILCKMNEYYKFKREWWKKILTLKISELPLEPKI